MALAVANTSTDDPAYTPESEDHRVPAGPRQEG
jgi:hypothetical protein